VHYRENCSKYIVCFISFIVVIPISKPAKVKKIISLEEFMSFEDKIILYLQE
jgi:hypothetical protein